jgi:protein SCO1/2
MRRAIVIGIYALLGVVVVSAFAFVTLQPIQVLPRIRLSPGFALTDQDGQRLTNEDLRGSIVVYNFTYTNCQAPCPQSSPTMREIQKRLAEMDLGGIPVKLVTISFDTRRDTAQALKAYAAAIGADESNWRFVTAGDEKLLKTIIGSGFETYYAEKPDGSFAYDPTYVLVDGWGIIRGEYQYQTIISNVDRIVRHVGVVVEEIQNSVGSARYAYEAAHLFLCYAP